MRNLSKEVEEADLRVLFEPFGTVETVTLVTDKESGRRVGFGFVRMPEREEALSAINGLKGVLLKGRKLEFHESRNRFERRGSPDRRSVPRGPPERRSGDRRRR